MRIVNLKCTNTESFKYLVLISLHYCDLIPHPERLSKLKKYEDRYIFIHNTPENFEIDNPNISLTIVDENNDILYASNNNVSNKAKIVKINDYRYAAIKPSKNKFIKLEELLESVSYTELIEYLSATNLDQEMKNGLLTLLS